MMTLRAAFLTALLAAPVDAQVIVSNAGQPFHAIDSTWSRPTRRGSTIRVKNDTESCPARGGGGDMETNRHKNRTDIPDTSYFITLDAIRSLPDTALWRKGRTRTGWKAADRRVVYPYEGLPVTVIGYFEIVRPQSGGSGESTNCNATLERDTDWHVALVAHPSEREEQAVVIEPTPRFKRRNAGWIPATARDIAIRRTANSARNETVPRVRVTGFLMLDPAHPDHIRGACTTNCGPPKRFYRATLWEIHPVTRIEVWRNNAWVDLNDY